MERCSVFVEDGEGFRSRALSGKVVARRHREMREGVWADIKKRKITHFFTLFFRNLKEIKKISFSILLCSIHTIWWFKTAKVYVTQELSPKKKTRKWKNAEIRKRRKKNENILAVLIFRILLLIFFYSYGY